MPLRRISFSRKHATVTSPPVPSDAMSNGKNIEKVTISKTNGVSDTITAATTSSSGSGTVATETTPPQWGEAERPASAGRSKTGRSTSMTSSSDIKEFANKSRDGKNKPRRSSASSSSITSSSSKGGLAHVRKTSRECVIPEPIDLTGRLTISDVGEIGSPALKIEDYEAFGNSQQMNKSRPITLQRIKNEATDCISIQELSQSPQRFSGGGGIGRGELVGGASADPESKTRLSVTSLHDSVDGGDTAGFHPPSSPLLVAMRRAVDSLSQFDDFEILEEIGSGFFAEVFKVLHKPTRQLMVLKKSKRKTVSLLKEVELLKRLKHPNILHYVGACIHAGQLNPLTEYVSGGTLEQLLQGPEELRWPRRLRLSLDISKGMQYLHEHGMFHRDLNSRNVLLRRHDTRYTAVVADFGLAAKTIPPSSSFNKRKKQMKRAQSIVGTPYWMAPEVLNGKPYDKSADVFSYGIVLCEVISRLSADPDDIPRSKDYGLDEEAFRKVPAVVKAQCPEEVMELAVLACKLLPVERPEFSNITTRLYIIRELHPGTADSAALSQESLDDTDDTIVEPQPPIRLGHHQSLSPPDSPPSFSTQRSTGFIIHPLPRQPSLHASSSTAKETRV